MPLEKTVSVWQESPARTPKVTYAQVLKQGLNIREANGSGKPLSHQLTPDQDRKFAESQKQIAVGRDHLGKRPDATLRALESAQRPRSTYADAVDQNTVICNLIAQPSSIDISQGTKFLTLKRLDFQPLETSTSIRLLHLDSSNETAGTPRLRIFNTTLESAPPYTALSYVWGNLQETSPIRFVDGKFLNVTRNLSSALKQFLKEQKELFLWIDQCCINQHDLLERGQQVEMMMRIFNSATETIIWLGKENEGTEKAYELIEKVEMCKEWRLERALEFNHLTVQELKEALRDDEVGRVLEEPREKWISLCNLLSLKTHLWYERLWVLQEAVVSSEVLVKCGLYSCSLASLTSSSILVGINSLDTFGIDAIGRCTLLDIYTMKTMYLSSSLSLLSVLRLLCFCYECFDCRDYLYGVLGLQSGEEMVKVHVDYTKSPQEVFVDVTRELIRKSGSLAIFDLENGVQDMNLPSWVPRYDRTPRVSPQPIEPVYLNDGEVKVWDACVGRLHVFKECGEDEKILAVKGNIVDGVKQVVERDLSYDESLLNSSTCGYLRFMIPKLLALLQVDTKKHEERKDSYIKILRVLTTGRYDRLSMYYGDSKEHWECDESWDMMDQLVSASPSPSLLSSTSKLNDWLEELGKRIRWCVGRRVALLSSGSLGLVPEITRDRDIVAVLNGSCVPIVLRKFSWKGKVAYRVIGRCFVDDIMFGEGLKGEEDRILLV